MHSAASEMKSNQSILRSIKQCGNRYKEGNHEFHVKLIDFVSKEQYWLDIAAVQVGKLMGD